jgi:hypothetical protein
MPAICPWSQITVCNIWVQILNWPEHILLVFLPLPLCNPYYYIKRSMVDNYYKMTKQKYHVGLCWPREF